jgi:TRAP-type mannitol/chloroaromatic compound transport system permease small subunit
MQPWLRLSRAIDRLNEAVGRLTLWLVLAASLISAGNALVRKSLGMSSNAWLEIQWYLFAAMVLLAAGYTLKHNGHVRIDVIAARLTERARAWIEIFGLLFFLLPLCALMIQLSWPGFAESFTRQEWSPDAGGLIRWPVRLLIPLGFALLALQGVSELIKRIAFLRGLIRLETEAAKEQV